MLTAQQLKEHTLNRLGYGPSVWHSDSYDSLGFDGYVAQQLDGSLRPVENTGTTVEAKLDRSAMARRQLEAVLIDFWFNHFNVDSASLEADKRARSILGRNIDHHQNVAIAPSVLGSFSDMLLATTQSPTMLDYLDNRLNRAPGIVNGAPVGINENFAREVMELHTFGVEAGYTDTDVIEVARLLTGWGTESIRLSGPGGMPDYEEFKFFADRHDTDSKTVLGVSYPAGGGYEEGVDFLAWLAAQPGTAQRLSAKLCARLIHEVPPQGAVNAATAAWANGGDLRGVTTAAISSTAFTAVPNFRSKAKPPHRYVASALMAMAATTANDWADIEDDLVAAVLDAGETPYIVGPPTGYPESSAFWISTASMLSRVQIAQTIAWTPTLRSRLMARVGVSGLDLESIFDGVAARMIPGGVSAATRTASLDYLAIAPGAAEDRYSTAAALVLSSPEFMVF